MGILGGEQTKLVMGSNFHYVTTSGVYPRQIFAKSYTFHYVQLDVFSFPTGESEMEEILPHPGSFHICSVRKPVLWFSWVRRTVYTSDGFSCRHEMVWRKGIIRTEHSVRSLGNLYDPFGKNKKGPYKQYLNNLDLHMYQ